MLPLLGAGARRGVARAHVALRSGAVAPGPVQASQAGGRGAQITLAHSALGLRAISSSLPALSVALKPVTPEEQKRLTHIRNIGERGGGRRAARAARPAGSNRTTAHASRQPPPPRAP